jgi:hypothetical protein
VKYWKRFRRAAPDLEARIPAIKTESTTPNG